MAIPLSPSSAQTVLRICELDSQIVEYSSPRDVCSLARTCRLTFNSLMPLLWENVKGIDQLFALLPDTKITIYNSGDNKYDGSGSLIIHFPISLSEEGLARFRLYSPFVRKMELYNVELYKEYTMHNWKTIFALSRGTPLLPNLHSLVVSQSAWLPNQIYYQSRLPWLILFISPSLQKLTTRVTNIQSPPIFSLAGASCLLRILVNVCPHLHALDMFPTQRLEPFYQDQMFISELGEEEEGGPEWFRHLAMLGNLQSVCIAVPVPQQAGLHILGGLPQLERLELALLLEHFHQDQPTLTTPLDSFPRLHHLALYRLPDLKFFRAIWNLDAMVTNLGSVKLHFDKYRWPDLMSYDQLFDLLSIICERSPDVSDLAIYPPYEGTGDETSEIIHALLSRLPLRSLCFAPVTPAVLNVGNWATTYPLLQKLELLTSWTRPVDLRALAQSLPNLSYFALKLSISSTQVEDRAASINTSRHTQPIVLRVVELFVSTDEGEDPILNEQEIDKGFRSIWPYAQFLLNDKNALARNYVTSRA